MAKMSEHGTSENEGKAWGKGQFANMPKEVKMSAYPKGSKQSRNGLDDTITGIDRETGQMEGKRNKYVSDQH